jgi:bacterioferritin
LVSDLHGEVCTVKTVEGTPMTSTLQIDGDDIRKRAEENVECGAVTEAYAADRAQVLAMLNEVLATETVCALRYRNNHHAARGIQAEAVAEEFLEHALQEEEHAHRIATRIGQLGGEPNLDPHQLAERSHARYTGAGSLAEMLRNNLIEERVAIETYTQIIRWLGDDDPTTRRLMESILEDEEEHADDLARILQGASTTH